MENLSARNSSVARSHTHTHAYVKTQSSIRFSSRWLVVEWMVWGRCDRMLSRKSYFGPAICKHAPSDRHRVNVLQSSLLWRVQIVFTTCPQTKSNRIEKFCPTETSKFRWCQFILMVDQVAFDRAKLKRVFDEFRVRCSMLSTHLIISRWVDIAHILIALAFDWRVFFFFFICNFSLIFRLSLSLTTIVCSTCATNVFIGYFDRAFFCCYCCCFVYCPKSCFFVHWKKSHSLFMFCCLFVYSIERWKQNQFENEKHSIDQFRLEHSTAVVPCVLVRLLCA